MPENPQPDATQRPASLARWYLSFAAGSLAVLLFAGFAGASVFYYLRFARPVDERLARGAFADTVNLFGVPEAISVGDRLIPDQLVSELRRGAYSSSSANAIGWYRYGPGFVEIHPGRDSAGGQPARIEFLSGHVSKILTLDGKAIRQRFEFGPPLVANLTSHRERRLLVRYAQIPPSVMHAVISIEDKRFFDHSGVDLLRIVKAAYVDLKDGRKEQGASTLTMQLARSFWLDPDKRWKRKIEEVLIALHLELKLTKQQIFEDYANQVYLGSRGSYSISGLGEAARAYFSEDLSQLDNAQAATLAGMIQRPSYFNPLRFPERTLERRNLVLSLMKDNGYLSESEYTQAIREGLGIHPQPTVDLEGRYFVSMMNDELHDRLGETADSAHSVYSTLDPELQQAARQAVQRGMQAVDRMLAAQGRKNPSGGEPQVALIALDPHTGEIRALVGGRDFTSSQLNHVLAMRQPGSVFKPFVYAAALHTAIAGANPSFTPASILDDSPATFFFYSQVYQPQNFRDEYMGKVTLETALANSLNSATVQLAEQVGFERVLELARQAGLNGDMQPTPALALGAYEASPLEIAEAYTVFANGGSRVKPTTLSLVKSAGGKVLYRAQPTPQPVLDSRIAYQLDSMMQQVLRRGTASSVTAHGFNIPAAGKTGTTRDGWFAGFTSKLLCVVWVGFDDNRDLRIEGSRSALPIWTDFMEQAATLDRYRNPQPFPQPRGIVEVRICTDTGTLAGPCCPQTDLAAFLAGTQPKIGCRAPEQRPVASGTNPATGEAARSAIEEQPSTVQQPAATTPAPPVNAISPSEAQPAKTSAEPEVPTESNPAAPEPSQKTTEEAKPASPGDKPGPPDSQHPADTKPAPSDSAKPARTESKPADSSKPAQSPKPGESKSPPGGTVPPKAQPSPAVAPVVPHPTPGTGPDPQ